MHSLVKLVQSLLASKCSVFVYKMFLPNKSLLGVTGSIKSLSLYKYAIGLFIIQQDFFFFDNSKHFFIF